MSAPKVESWLELRLPLIIKSLAASLAFEIGLTEATALSHPGKLLEGKRALLVKISGSVRKLTTATSESMRLK